ncbi:MAG: AAA family ATPase [Syntrophobacteraceae bacterium]
MSIVTISRQAYSRGGEVAQRVAQTLGYRCIGRELVLDASKEFKLPETMFNRAIHDAPSLLERITDRNKKYIACFQVALLRQLRLDFAVYHGLAGHFFVKDVPHALKVRIIADRDERLKTQMERLNIEREEALRILEHEDEERREWSLNEYGIDTADPCLYDLVIHLGDITVDDAAKLICYTVRSGPYRTTRQSQKTIEDLTLASEIRAALIAIDLTADVRANDGYVEVEVKFPPIPSREKKELVHEMKTVIRSLPGVRWVAVKTTGFVKG